MDTQQLLFLLFLFNLFNVGQIYHSSNIFTTKYRILIKTILKTLSHLNPNFVKEIFYLFLNLNHRKDNLYVHTRNTINFGDKSLGHLGTYMEPISRKNEGKY